MPFLPLPDETTAKPEARAVLAETKQRWGFLPNIVRALAIRPDLMQAEDVWSKAVMYQGKLPRPLKEAVATTVSVVNDCNYCATSHAYAAQREGAPADVGQACKRLDFSGFDTRTRLACEFARKAAADMNSVRQADVEALRKGGFTPEEIVELAAVIGSFMMYNTFVTVLGLELEDFQRGRSLLARGPAGTPPSQP